MAQYLAKNNNNKKSVNKGLNCKRHINKIKNKKLIRNR